MQRRTIWLLKLCDIVGCGQRSSYLCGFAVPTTGRTPERRARVTGGDPVQRFVMRRRVTHDFWAEQQFSREDFFERQRHHTRPDDVIAKNNTHTHRNGTTTHHRHRTTETDHDLNTSEDICGRKTTRETRTELQYDNYSPTGMNYIVSITDGC